MSANPALILLPGMHGRSATQEVKDELATIMSDFHPAGFRLMARSLADSDTRDVLRAVRAPTLLVWGEEDVRSPVSVGAMESLIPGARLVVIPRAGHLSNVESPLRFNSVLRAFCLEGGAR